MVTSMKLIVFSRWRVMAPDVRSCFTHATLFRQHDQAPLHGTLRWIVVVMIPRRKRRCLTQCDFPVTAIAAINAGARRPRRCAMDAIELGVIRQLQMLFVFVL